MFAATALLFVLVLLRTAAFSMTSTTQKEVAETCFSYLHMELVQMMLKSENSTAQGHLQRAGRKVEAVGFQVGQRLVERYTKELPRFTEVLDVIKFICKEFWFEVYRKQIDKLQTNNKVHTVTLLPIHAFRDRHIERVCTKLEGSSRTESTMTLESRFTPMQVPHALPGRNATPASLPATALSMPDVLTPA